MGQRICPGYDVTTFNCGCFMSYAAVDPHTLCGVCRKKKWGRDCSPSTACWQCEVWPEELWEVYKAMGKFSDRNKSKSSPNPSPVSTEHRRSSSKPPDADTGVSPLPPVRQGSTHRPASLVTTSPTSGGRSLSVAQSSDRSVGQSTLPSGPEASGKPFWSGRCPKR